MTWKSKKLFYRVVEVAELLSVHRDTVYTLVLIGELLAHNRLPGRKGMRITGTSIEAYIERHLVPAEELQFDCHGEEGRR